MTVTARSLGTTLADLIGRERVREAAGVTVDGVPAGWVAAPAAVGQVAAVLALARDEGLAVIPRGSGSALDLGHPPARADIVLDLRGLDHVLEDQPADLTVTVQAGVTAGDLAARLGARGQWLPVDPPGWRMRTLGGLAATGAAGPLRTRYGAIRDLLLGVRFVQADGVLTWGGAKVVKSVTGYDVPKLLVGSYGTLGVLVELTLRLHPVPEVDRTWLASFTSADAAQAFVARLVDSTVQPLRVEFLDAPAARACAAGPAAATIAVSLGSVEAAVVAQGAQVERIARSDGGVVVPAAVDFWARHDEAGMRRDGEVVLHVSSLASHLATTVAAIERAVQRAAGASARVTGGALLGTLRASITGGEPERLAAAVEELRGVVAALGGAVVVQGSRAVRERVDPWGAPAPGVAGLMREIKTTFDPTRVLNPGRFVGAL
jgi:glycolate oxidase FAD binding subunit